MGEFIMSKLKIDLKYTGLNEKAIMKYADEVKSIHDELQKNAKKTDIFFISGAKLALFVCFSKCFCYLCT